MAVTSISRQMTRLLAIALISSIQCAIGDHYGQRLTSESMAKAGIDDRITAILNSASNVNYQSSVQDLEAKNSLDVKGETPVIEVTSSEIPVAILFKTRSPMVNVQQQHIPGIPAKVESTRTEEEPQRLFHEVYRPVIQELREVIQPYRRYLQQIQPVIEDVQQIISSGQRSGQQNVGGAVGMSDLRSASVMANEVMSPLLSETLSYQSSRNRPTTVLSGTVAKVLNNELTKPSSVAQRAPAPKLMTLGQRSSPITQALPVAANSLKMSGTLIHQQPKSEALPPNVQLSGSGRPVKYDTYFLMGGALDGIALDKSGQNVDKRVGLQKPITESSIKREQQMSDSYILDYSVPIGFQLSNDRQFRSKLFENHIRDSYKTFELDLTHN